MTKGPGMRRVCAALEERGFRLSEADAVETFARQGDWHTVDYCSRVKSLEAWEIDAAHFEALGSNVPQAIVRHVDSVEHARRPENVGAFDFVVVDNPQCLFGESGRYCEHFEIIDSAVTMLRRDGVVVFNVNNEPFDYDAHPAWRERRERFYGSTATSSMPLAWLEAFYAARFESAGKRVADSFCVERASYLHYMVFRLTAPV